MAFEHRDILYAAIVSKNKDFKLVQNDLMKQVGPTGYFLPMTDDAKVPAVSGQMLEKLWQFDAPKSAEEQFFPLTFSRSGGHRFMLPYEPHISISGGNRIVRRDIAKAKTEHGQILGGSVKERFTQRDYEITITGALYGNLITGSVEDAFPRADFEKLRDYMIAAESLQVFCEPLQLLGIDQIVIEDFSFPFTKGEYVQAYEIKAYSDIDYPLLLDLND